MGHGSDAFDVIPYEDIKGGWKKLGSGSFGNVYKGNYLGIDVAIKEVLPSTEYDVNKYFEREWRLMKETRHPNVVLYLGLSVAPDGRIFIISEFIPNGNLRMYIHDKSKPFPWRLRLSFATDIARALAYLHARRCIHRDLKGENVLCTENGRLKITDFGFARIAARNEEESKRLTFCGTDAYMSPEILLGEEFDLPTDIFSLGIIFCEIASRQLSDDDHFKRHPPSFGIDADEVRAVASTGCPPAFLKLCLDCLSDVPADRPNTTAILDRLRDIEAEVRLRPSEDDDYHVGSVKFMTAGKRPAAAPRIPSFGGTVDKTVNGAEAIAEHLSSDDENSDDELVAVVKGLQSIDLGSRWSDAAADHSGDSTQPLINSSSSVYSTYSTAVVWSHSPQATNTVPPSLSSILTIRPSPQLGGDSTTASEVLHNDQPPGSLLSIESYHTAASSISSPSIAVATEGGSSIRSLTLVHRFTLLKPGAKRTSVPAFSKKNLGSPETAVWNPLDIFFSSGLLVAKCDICNKRLGWKPVLQCDDCGLRSHVKCGENAPRDCGIRPIRPIVNSAPSFLPISKIKK